MDAMSRRQTNKTYRRVYEFKKRNKVRRMQTATVNKDENAQGELLGISCGRIMTKPDMIVNII